MKNISLIITLFVAFFFTSIHAQEEELGLASYYSDDFQGRNTAYGDTYDKDEMTCAHKRHSYGTRLRVTRLDNNKSVVVKVIDKGPFIKGRIVDLSRRAANELGILDMGSVKVKVEKISNSRPQEATVAEVALEEPVEEVSTPDPIPVPAEETQQRPIEEPEPIVETKIEEPAPAPVPTRTEPREKQTIEPKVVDVQERGELVGNEYNPFGLYKFALEKPGEGGYGVQVASLSNFDNVLKKVASLQSNWFTNILISMEAGTGGNNQYKVILGPFTTQKEAQHYQASMKSRYRINGFVIDLSQIKY